MNLQSAFPINWSLTDREKLSERGNYKYLNIAKTKRAFLVKYIAFLISFHWFRLVKDIRIENAGFDHFKHNVN